MRDSALAILEQMRNNAGMSISLTAEQETLAKNLVKSGIYQNVEVAITAALKAEAEFRAWEKREVEKGLADVDRGQLMPLDDVIDILTQDHEEQFGLND